MCSSVIFAGYSYPASVRDVIHCVKLIYVSKKAKCTFINNDIYEHVHAAGMSSQPLVTPHLFILTVEDSAKHRLESETVVARRPICIELETQQRLQTVSSRRHKVLRIAEMMEEVVVVEYLLQ